MSSSFKLKEILRNYLLSYPHIERLKNNSSNNIISILRIEEKSKCANCDKRRANVDNMDVHTLKIWYYDNGFVSVNNPNEDVYYETFPIWCDWVCDVCFDTTDVGKQWECIWLKDKGFTLNNILNSEEKEIMTKNFKVAY